MGRRSEGNRFCILKRTRRRVPRGMMGWLCELVTRHNGTARIISTLVSLATILQDAFTWPANGRLARQNVRVAPSNPFETEARGVVYSRRTHQTSVSVLLRVKSVAFNCPVRRLHGNTAYTDLAPP